MMTRKCIRLKNYDYSQDGAYFITICMHNRECIFGKINDGVVFVSRDGRPPVAPTLAHIGCFKILEIWRGSGMVSLSVVFH
jgi:hypothetical protein